MPALLDGPPPSPAVGQPPTPSPASLIPPSGGAGGAGLPPDVLRGTLQSVDTIGKMLDSFAALFPQSASQFSMIKDLLSSAFAGLLNDGSAAGVGVAPSRPFPGTVSAQPPQGTRPEGM